MKARRTIALRISAKDQRLLERMIREWIGPDDETQDDHETDRALRRVHAALRAARLDRAVDALRARLAIDAERARAVRAEAERDARPAISPELAIRFLAHETDPGVFRKVTDAVADFGTVMVERAAKSRPSPARCEICDWPLHDTIDKGCTAESCSYRPEFGSEEHRRIAARRKELAAKVGGGT